MSSASDETELAGDDVSRALANAATGPEVATALIGCLYYRDDPLDLAEIIEPDRETGGFVMMRGPKRARLPLPWLANGYIIERRVPPRLPALVAAARPAHLTAADTARRQLSALGIRHPGLTNEDAVELAAAVADAGRRRDMRGKAAAILQRCNMHRQYIQLAQGWLAAAPLGEALVDVVIQLARSNRMSNQLDEALSQTNIVVSRGASERLTEDQRAILFTQRAAILLDLYERDEEGSRYHEAKACADRAWALRQSEQCSNVYGRLHHIPEPKPEGMRR